MKQLKELRSITNHEKSEFALHQGLKDRDKSAYGIINALLHMDSNAEVYEQTDSQFFLYWRGYVETNLRGFEKG